MKEITSKLKKKTFNKIAFNKKKKKHYIKKSDNVLL